MARRLVYHGLLVILIYASLEIMTSVAYAVRQERLPSFAEWRRLQAVSAEVPVAELPEGYVGGAGSHAFNPYLGYTFDPEDKPWWAESIDEFGFLNERSPLEAPAGDEVVLAILGGSVSHQVSTAGQEALLNELRRLPKFRGKRFVTLRFGVGGYKQPQSMLTLAYLISLGARFDIVLNIDGFNEVALPFVTNTPFGTSPYYPMYWHALLPWANEPMDLRALARVELFDGLRRRYAAAMLHSPARFSASANVVWFYADRLFQRWANQARAAVYRRHGQARRYSRNGPQIQLQAPHATYQALVDNWAAASREMDALARSVGATYFHILQPNQYLPGSKPLSPDEVQRAYDVRSRYREHVELGYPALARAGRALSDGGIRFADLSLAFRDVTETLYGDDCCHLTERGAELLGREIGRRMAAWYRPDQGS